MAENSKIEWTHHTFNPWIGCQKVGPGCDHCYAEAWDARGSQPLAQCGAWSMRENRSPAGRSHTGPDAGGKMPTKPPYGSQPKPLGKFASVTKPRANLASRAKRQSAF